MTHVPSGTLTYAKLNILHSLDFFLVMNPKTPWTLQVQLDNRSTYGKVSDTITAVQSAADSAEVSVTLYL